jgi:hypothetical protein
MPEKHCILLQQKQNLEAWIEQSKDCCEVNVKEKPLEVANVEKKKKAT